jgi:hypothetical protein
MKTKCIFSKTFSIHVVFLLESIRIMFFCDVVLMHATYLLLGYPWQFDEKTNIFFKRKGRFLRLYYCYLDMFIKINWSWKKDKTESSEQP